MGFCDRCHGTGILYRQDTGAHGLTLPCPDCLIDEYDDFDDHDCANCGGEGFTYGCSWDWQCPTYDAGEDTCLCTRRCDWCNPPKLTDEQKAERAALEKIMSDALNRPQSSERKAG